MRDNDLLSLAYKIAQEAHGGAVDKGGYYYMLHPVAVASIVCETDEKIVALLHDVIGDSDITLDILSECGFSEKIVTAVDAISKCSEESRKSYLYRVKNNSLARIVKIADLKHNCDLSRIKNPTKRDITRTQNYGKEILFLSADETEGS